MENEEMPKFVELLMALSLSYRQSLNEFTIERYWETLKPFNFADVKQALYCCTTQNPDKGHFMPEATEILRHITDSSEIQALKAWLLVVKVIERVGSYNTVVFDDPILHRIIDDMGGWRRLCETTLDEMKFRGHEFKKLYAAYAMHPPAEYPKELKGIANTHKEQPPVLIGDIEKAKQVYNKGIDNRKLIHTGTLLLEQTKPNEALEPPKTESEE